MSLDGGLSVGIDVGGTFTDLVAVGADGATTTRKVLSTPADQSEGVLGALAALGAAPAAVARLVHGTTVATNTLLERTGARVVLGGAAGARDLLELRRQERASLYDLTRHHEPPLVPHDLVVGVAARLVPDRVARPLRDADATEAARAAAALDAELVAVALLHAYQDAGHERQLDGALRAVLPGCDVVCSSDVLPEIREYERTATTVAEAYARPRVATYLRRLATRLDEAAYPAPAVMTSAGGVRSAVDAARNAASLALSGPAGGVVGAALVARAVGVTRALTIDIGGTSADVGLVLDGEPLVESGGEVAGVPIALPRVLVETVSSGGGSVAWMDDGGALRVGPRSAGARPGPAAFLRGGVEPTVTDAHVVLGHIGAGVFSGGVVVDVDAARAAVGALAERLRVDVAHAARAIVATADAEMARALRRVSVERGIDPRGCVLVGFGGGGPLHACALADLVGASAVLIPPHAGVLSAVGLAAAAERREAAASVMRGASELDATSLGRVLDDTAERAGQGARRQWWLRARYVGQGYELDVPVERGEDGAQVGRRFAEMHASRTGFTLERDVEIVSARHVASSAGREPTFRRHAADARDEPQAATGSIVDDGSALDMSVAGSATIVLPDATLYVAEGWSARALEVGGWMLERR